MQSLVQGLGSFSSYSLYVYCLLVSIYYDLLSLGVRITLGSIWRARAESLYRGAASFALEVALAEVNLSLDRYGR